MLFFEVFDRLHEIPSRLRTEFTPMEVRKVVVSKSTGDIKTLVNCSRLLPYEDKKKMEGILKKQVFFQMPGEVHIHEHYQLEREYGNRELFLKIKDNFLRELQEKSRLLYSILSTSELSWEGDVLCVSLEDNFLSYQFESEFRTWAQALWNELFDRSLEFNFTYYMPKQEELEDYDAAMEQALQASSHQTSSGQQIGSIPSPAQTLTAQAGLASLAAGASADGSPVRGTATAYEAPKGKTGSGQKRYRRAPNDPDVFYGKNVEGPVTPISDIQDAVGEVVVVGDIVNVQERDIKGEKKLVIFSITDYTDTISAKLFLKQEQAKEVCSHLREGAAVRVKGIAAMDNFDREIALTSLVGIKAAEPIRRTRQDLAPEKRIELHAHTFMSDMDGLVSAKALVNRAKEWGHPAIAITDHGVVQSFTEAFHALERDDPFQVIYGCECYLVDDTARMVWGEGNETLFDRFVVFDLETTGLHPADCAIIEIGAVKVENGQISDRYSVFVNPECLIPPHITELTSITNEMVADAKPIREILPEFLDFAKDAVLVAHNASFDVSFLEENARRLGLPFSPAVVDTVAMSRMLLPQLTRHTLNRVCKELNISLEHHHRAVDDAGATAEIFLEFARRFVRQGKTTLRDLAVMDRLPAAAAKNLRYYHCVLLAANDVGRVNLYRLVSYSHLDYFNKRPLMPKSLIQENREGLLIGSACEAGEVFRALLAGREEDELAQIVSFYDYLEIQPIGNNAFMIASDREEYQSVHSEEDLRNLNRKVVELGEMTKKPVVATGDVHFMDPEDEVYRRIIQAGKGYKDADSQSPLYFHTTDEMLEEFAYLGREKAYEVVIKNPKEIAGRLERIAPVRPDKCPPVIPDSDKTLTSICYEKAHSMYGDPLPEIVQQRLEKELSSIIKNGFAVMYIIAQKLVWKSNEDGYLVGSRGSVGSSLVATMAGITEVNPLPAHYYCPDCHFVDFDSEEVRRFAGSSGCDMPDRLCPVCGSPLLKDGHDIPFETFLGFYGDKEPDIDLNFSGEYQSRAHDYTEVIFGKGHTFRAGTIGTLAEKTAYGFVKNYFEDRGIPKRKAEIDRLVKGCVGVRRTTGQHPGGIIVLPHGEEIYSFTPVQRPANDMNSTVITTHFEYHSIDHNLLKLDILGHDDPTMIRMLEDLTGLDARTIPLDDPGVLSLFANLDALHLSKEDLDGCDLGALGVPEFGTDFAMQMLRETKPKCFSDLVRIAGLAHGTDVWLNNAQKLILEGTCTLSTAICTRDDIMIYLIGKGLEKGLAFQIMESVRKGRGLTPEMEKSMLTAGVPDWYIWSCKHIQYMFPKAHAVAYVMMALRIAYYKVYYPLAFYAAFFSIRAKAFNYVIMCRGKETLQNYLQDYKRRSNELTQKEQDAMRDMRVVQEMYARGFEFLPLDLYHSSASKFQVVDGKLLPPFSSIDGLGDKVAEAIVTAREEGSFLSVEDFRNRCKVSATVTGVMNELGIFGDLPQTNQISLADFL